jgi:glycosyltransferase involved in cell wall biosynthesis
VDVLLAEYASAGWLFLRSCEKASVKLFVHFHGLDASRNLHQPFWVARYRELFKRSSGIIAPSRFIANNLSDIGCPLDKLHVSPCGVDPNKFTPGRGEPLRLVAVGRLVEKKAPHLTIKAFAGVLQQFPGARLDMIGDGPLREQCQSLIAHRGLDDGVRLLGVRSSEDVAAALKRASLFIQHSVTAPDGNTEGLPVALLEAMASGLPVVATRHSGIPEAVSDGETGILVEEHDVAGMTKAIGALLADPGRAEAMGKAGRARVLAQFTEAHMRDRLRAVMGLSLGWRLRNRLSRRLSSNWTNQISQEAQGRHGTGSAGR